MTTDGKSLIMMIILSGEALMYLFQGFANILVKQKMLE
jgi:hypothetical protein